MKALIIMLPLRRRTLFIVALSIAFVAACGKGAGRGDDAQAIGPLLAPSALAARMTDVKSGKVAVLYVGPDLMFDLGHIPGARNLGPASTDEGLKALNDALVKTPAETEIVVYCGCCPYSSCPNVRPASAAIRALRRKNARVLDLPTKFATDWIDQGYPVEPP